MTILDELAAYARERTEMRKAQVPLAEMRARAEEICRLQAKADPLSVDSRSADSLSGEVMNRKGESAFASAKATGPKAFAFEEALRRDGMSFICECKKASPSKGVIAEDFPYLQIARDYEAAGADCISVLTEPRWFLGSDAYLEEIAAAVNVPCLRKDFTVDEYMIYEAKVLGAGAVLLICSILEPSQLSEYAAICNSLGLTALFETHNEGEVYDAVVAGARVIGVNNRNLADFSVDTGNSAKLRKLVPPGVIFVAESGIRTAADVRALEAIGVDAVLVGETLMRAADKKTTLAELRGKR